MKCHVKQCMAPSGRIVRFDAGVGDVVLLSNGNRSYVEATIRAIKSADVVVVSVLDGPNEVEREVSASAIHGLMLGG